MRLPIGRCSLDAEPTPVGGLGAATSPSDSGPPLAQKCDLPLRASVIVSLAGKDRTSRCQPRLMSLLVDAGGLTRQGSLAQPKKGPANLWPRERRDALGAAGLGTVGVVLCAVGILDHDAPTHMREVLTVLGRNWRKWHFPTLARGKTLLRFYESLGEVLLNLLRIPLK